jgi:predicted PurR-regulated permease PerM
MIRAFITGNVVTGFLLILAHAAVFRWVNLDNWLPLAILTGFLNLVPIIGAPLAIILPYAQAIIQFNHATPFIVIAVALIAYHLIAGNLVLPFFMSSRVNVNAVSLLFGLLFWGWLWGAMGFLLAIPMTALVKTFLESNQSTFAISNLLAARPRHVIPWAERSAAPRGKGTKKPDTFSDAPPV